MEQFSPTNAKALIFDFDGTIADSFPTFVRAVEYALKRKPFTPEEVEDLRTYSAREARKVLKVKLWSLPFVVARGMQEMDRHQDEITIFPGMSETIKTLHAQGYTLYIVSSHSDQGIRLFLERYDLTQEFDHIYSKAGLFGKPRAIRKLQRRFHYLSDECVFIGDEARDIEAANKTNMQCISVSWGFNTTAALKAHHPSALVDTPQQLLNILTT